MKYSFRSYQPKIITQVNRHLSNGGDALIDQPGGSGKTIEIIASTTSLFGAKFSHIICSAPQQQIEENFISKEERIFEFESNGAASSQIVVPSALFQLSRENGRNGTVV